MASNVEALDLNQKRLEDIMHNEGGACAVYVVALPNGDVKVRFMGESDLYSINNMLGYAIYTAHDEGYRSLEEHPYER